MEQTFVALKPDAVQRGIIGDIISRFERAGLKIVAMKMVTPDEAHFHEHYENIGQLISRRGEEVYRVALAAMMEAPVVAMVLEGIDAVEHVRKMVGATDPKESAPGTIRGDFTHISRSYAVSKGRTLPNIIHASADVKEAAEEIKLWFSPAEMHTYQGAHHRVVHGRKP
ncbi:MAG: nucleoside-diphosphate kinase [Candidatus Chaera renei]|uniref:Nucleoside diphosphate kinase n=1 Tax=Candidatus Chaera renei TaxID=2506947 RepID=A0A4Q0AKJ5_9BACT|nr:MAG: nucleoside-diphosphate kinase [Candidatus Chaera renei]